MRRPNRGSPWAGRAPASPARRVLVFAVLGTLTACGGGGFDLDFDEPAPVDPLVRQAPQLAVSAAGKATCVWEGNGGIYAERYLPGFGWTSSRPIDAGDGDASTPQVGTDASGDAVVVWEAGGGIEANEFVAGEGWGDPVVLAPPTDASGPQVALDPGGGGLAAWQQDGSAWASRFDKEGGWGAAVALDDGASEVLEVRVATAANGDALAAWTDAAGRVCASRYDAGADAWGAPRVLGDGAGPDVAMDDAGGGLVAFEGEGEIQIAEYDPVLDWSDAVPLPRSADGEPEAPRSPDVAVAEGGHAIVVFVQGTDVHVSEREGDLAFDASQPVDGDLFVDGDPHVDVDPAGDAAVAFADEDGHVHLVRRTAEAWEPPRDLGHGEAPQVGMDGEGKAILVFLAEGQIDGRVVPPPAPEDP